MKAQITTQLADDASFETHIGKTEEISVPKMIPEVFDRTFQDLFLESSKK